MYQRFSNPTARSLQSFQVECPPQILRYYSSLPIPNNYQCKYCGKFYNLDRRSPEDLVEHIRREHATHLAQKGQSLSQKLQNLKSPPKYLRKYEHVGRVTDQWLDRLALDDYPIADIARNIFFRLKCDHELFFRQCQERSQKVIQNKKLMISFLPQLPLSLLPQQIADILTTKFKISYEGAKLMIKKYSWSFLPENRMFDALEDRGVFIKRYDEFQATTITLFVSQRMRQNYRMYGDVVNVQYKFTPLKRARSGKHYNICLFLGQDKNIRPIVFGMALVNGECPLYYKLTLQFFMQAMNNIVPRTFITNETRAMQKVIRDLRRQLKKNIGHMVNWHYTMQKVKYDLNTEYEGQKFLDSFSAALSSITEEQYESVMKQIKDTNKIRPQRVALFQQMNERTCISKATPCFIGFGIQNERVNLITKFIQESFPYQNRMGLFYNLAFRLDQQLQHKSEKRKVFLDPRKIYEYRVKQLIYLSKVMQKQIFTKLIYLYQKSISELSFDEEEDDEYWHDLVVFQPSRDGPDQKFILNYDIRNQVWRCSCRLIYWSGLPCHHLIKVVRRFRGSISYYINTRWLMVDDLKGVPAFEEDVAEEEEDDILPVVSKKELQEPADK